MSDADAMTDDSPKAGMMIDELARLPDRAILDEARLAGVFGVTPRTVRRMVDRFELPPAVPLAGRSVWLVGRVLAYLDSKAATAEQEAAQHARKITRMTS